MFAPVKSHSAAIAFFQKVNLFHHLPSQSPAVCMVRQASVRKFGLFPKNRKAPFKWADIVVFATSYSVLQQGYCYLVVTSMAVLMFGGMCRYSDISRLRWRNLQFDNDGNLDVRFDHGGRKNSKFRQGATITVPPFRMRRFARCAPFENFKSSSSRNKRVLSLEAAMAAWWLRARARLPTCGADQIRSVPPVFVVVV